MKLPWLRFWFQFWTLVRHVQCYQSFHSRKHEACLCLQKITDICCSWSLKVRFRWCKHGVRAHVRLLLTFISHNLTEERDVVWSVINLKKTYKAHIQLILMLSKRRQLSSAAPLSETLYFKIPLLNTQSALIGQIAQAWASNASNNRAAVLKQFLCVWHHLV